MSSEATEAGRRLELMKRSVADLDEQVAGLEQKTANAAADVRSRLEREIRELSDRRDAARALVEEAESRLANYHADKQVQVKDVRHRLEELAGDCASAAELVDRLFADAAEAMLAFEAKLQPFAEAGFIDPRRLVGWNSVVAAMTAAFARSGNFPAAERAVERRRLVQQFEIALSSIRQNAARAAQKEAA